MTDNLRRVRHLKRGTTYTVIGYGKFQTAIHTAYDNEPVTIYRADKDGRLWVRPTDEFNDGRFEDIAAADAAAPAVAALGHIDSPSYSVAAIAADAAASLKEEKQ